MTAVDILQIRIADLETLIEELRARIAKLEAENGD